MASIPSTPVPDRSADLRTTGRAPPAEAAEAPDPLHEDLQLTRRLVAGEAAAWRTLVERYGRLVMARVLAAARELNRPLTQADAEDLCAEVFSELVADNYAALRRFEGRSTLSTWLCVVTRRMVLRRLASAGREPSLPAANTPALDLLVAAATDEPLASVISAENRALLAAGIQQLGERHRLIARLFYVDGRSYREISQQLNMPMNSIGPTLARIHEKLRAAMKHKEP